METYNTRGVCSSQINFEVEDNIIKDISFVGGCNGNLKGISNLIKGMDIDKVIERVEGIECGKRDTSCPDQLARALKEYRVKNNRKQVI